MQSYSANLDLTVRHLLYTTMFFKLCQPFFHQVLVVSGDEVKVGDPTVAGATVTATAVGDGKAKKVIVYKYKRKTGYHKKNGHRQAYTKVKIEKINA